MFVKEFLSFPIHGICTHIYHKNQPNVGKYTIHGSYEFVSFSKVGPKDQQYFHAVERSLREQGACFLRSKKAAERCATIHPGGGRCEYMGHYRTKKGGQKFQGAVGKRLGDGGEF